MQYELLDDGINKRHQNQNINLIYAENAKYSALGYVN